MDKQDWSNKKIIFELHERNVSLKYLSQQAGLSPSTLKNALRVSYPKGEKIIAKAIGVEASEIWPTRYLARKNRFCG